MLTQVDLPDALLPAERIRQLFAISDETCRNWIAAGKLPAPIRDGNRSYWDPREIQAFLDRSRQPASAQNVT